MQLGLTLPQAAAQSPARPPQQATMNGLLTAKPLSTIIAEETAAAISRANQAAAEPVVSSLSGMIRKHWTIAKRAKEPIEREMLTAVRSKRGEYDPDKLAEIKKQGGSEIYMMIFATKARQMKALLTDVMIGTGSEKPWTLNPSPKPELPPTSKNQIMQAVYEQVMQAEMMGMPMSVADVRQRMVDMKAEVENRIMEEARREAERAEVEIEDMMVEGGYLNALDEFLDDLTTFKTAFIKGPVVRMVPTMKWEQGPDGAFVPKVTTAPKAQYERVDPFNMYPAPWAKNVHDAFLIERHKLSRTALNSLRGVEGYSDDAIKAVLDAHGTGGLHEWLQVDTERAHAEGRENATTDLMSADLIDALQYWGSVSGKTLREWGMSAEEVQDEAKEYEVEAWLIGSWVIKAVINPDPLMRRPYYSDGFSRVPGAFWHNSLFDVVRDCQDMANGAARALSNNLGIASGPQVYVMVDRLAQGEEVTEMYPWKLWQMTSDPMGTNAEPIKFFQPSSHAAELMGVFEKFSQLADEYSGIPKYMAGIGGGEGGAGRTASGMSMMINNASKQVKQTTSSIDMNIIAPSVERTFQFCLQYKPELALQGDLNVKARGALSLVTKEAAQVRTNEFLAATANPIDMQILGLEGRAELLRHATKRLDISGDKVVPSETVVKQRAAVAMVQQQQQAMAEAQGAAQGGRPQGKPKQQGGGQELMNGAPTTDNFQPAGA